MNHCEQIWKQAKEEGWDHCPYALCKFIDNYKFLENKQCKNVTDQDWLDAKEFLLKILNFKPD